MLRRQKVCVLAGIAGLIAMSLFPPWYRAYRGVSTFIGYAPIFSPPQIARVELPLLCVQWAGVTAVTAGLVLLGGKRRTLPRPEAPQQAPSGYPAELMAVFNSLVASIKQFSDQKGVGDRIDAEETLAFAMAVVTELYTLGQGSAARATPALDMFHRDVEAFFASSLLKRDNSPSRPETLDHLIDHFFELLRSRYPEYRNVLRQAVRRKGAVFLGLSRLVLKRVFAERIPEEKLRSLLVPLAIQLAADIVSAVPVLMPTPTPASPRTPAGRPPGTSAD